VVVDTEARTPPGARVLDSAAPTLIAIAPDAAADHFALPVDVARLPRGPGGLDLAALLAALCARGVRAVLLEGGPTLAGSFVAAGLVDRVVAYLAPVLIGAGLPALAVPTARSMSDAWRLRMDEVVRLGSDLRMVAHPQNL
jgi:diaminohydroxyphosphoribosylaminopyrimidine deaminase/5-amino-6-(5-phosphoribosylamino)uracil reductase